MELSIWSSYYIDLPIEDAIQRFIENGIYCSELSDEHGLELLSRSENVIETASIFREFLNRHNFRISQGHLCLNIRICSDGTALERLFRWIDMYEAIGIQNMVLHCDNLNETGLSLQEKKEKNIEKLRILAQYIQNRNITVCLENLRPVSPDKTQLVDGTIDDLLYMIERIGSKQFGICLDTGHLNLTAKNHRAFILKAGEKLKALHIADNEGVTDQHLMPFTAGNIDFFEIVKSLREIGYAGVFNMEIPGENRIPLELRDEKLVFIKSCYQYLMRG